MEREKRIFMDQNDYGKRKAVCRHAAGFMAAVILAAAGQPSMAYASEKLQTNDPSASEQWAFFNDGSFTSEEVTKYPVYSDPFGAAVGEHGASWSSRGGKEETGGFRRGYQPETGMGDIWERKP